jgi:predicted metalloprotease with PDZ domain
VLPLTHAAGLALLLGCPGPRADAARLTAAVAAAPVAYRVTPVARDGRLDRLAVEVRLCGDADGETRLLLPDEWAGTPGLWQQVAGLEVEGATAVARDGDAARRLTHRPGAPLVVRYAVRPFAPDSAPADTADPVGAPFDKARPVVRPGWFFFHGEGVFAVPEAREAAPARFAWGALPAGWRVASDLDHLARGRAGTLGDVRESVALGAPDLRVETRVVDGAPVRVALRGAWTFADTALAGEVAALVRAQHRYWGERPAPFLVAVAPLAPPGGARSGERHLYGSGRGDGFSVAATTNADVPGERRLLAHEMMHRWVPGALGGLPAAGGEAEARDYWFGEGFNDYLAARVLLRAGRWTPARAAADLDSTLRRLDASPARALPNAEAAARVWRDPDATRLPYDRGHLVAELLDARLRAQTGGRRGLDDVLAAQYRAARAGRAGRWPNRGSAAARFPVVVRAVTGVDVSDALERHVERGEPVVLPPTVLGGCARVAHVTAPAFDRGFDARATQAAGGVVAGVDSGSAAWAAGLRDGLRFVRRESGVPGDATVPYVLRVSDGAREWTLRYLPASARLVTRQQVTAVGGAGAPAAAACRP